jgi:hypothetical protein
MFPPDAGFFVFKDAIVVIFYTNVLNGPTSVPILDDSENAAV